WVEAVFLGCSIERYEEIKSYDDLMAWMDEKPEHANSDFGLYWRMGLDIGLDRFGRGCNKFLSWGYLPHEDKFTKPTIDGRAAAVIRKGGIYDAARNLHLPADQAATREDTTHAWYEESDAVVHPFDRLTTPSARNEPDFAGKYSWSTAVKHAEHGRLESGPLARQLVMGGDHGEPWQARDPLVLDMHKAMGGPSALLRHFARMHEVVGLYREAERALRELRLNELWYIKPKERDGRGWGATEAARGALCHWIDVEGGKIKNYQIVSPTTWNVGPRAEGGELGPIEEALIGTPIADPADPVEVGHVARSYDSCLVCTVHAHDARTGAELARFRTA
ncbi:MAG TPA: nickel-dependent hydrogenase large subunit, partial [Stellaceae bacterium]|nr:nickel-dependent hydrogenase large subunit [Stellaceae bacterium]